MTSNTLSGSIDTATGIILTPGGSYASPFTIASSGTIYGTGSAGLFSAYASSISNFGAVFGANDGIALAAIGVVDNAGLISGGAGQTVYLGNTIINAAIGFFAGGTLTNLASGTIASTQMAVLGEGAGQAGIVTIDNSGLIAATDGTVRMIDGNAFTAIAINLTDGGDVINNTAGDIVGNQIGVSVQYSGGGNASLTNSGLIEAVGTVSMLNGVETYPSAVEFTMGGTIINAASGQILGSTGVLLSQGTSGAATTLSNLGSIEGGIVGTVLEDGNATNYGLIAGGYTGILGVDSSLTNMAGGVIAGQIAGADLVDSGLTNSGTIIASGTTYFSGGATLFATAVDLTSGGALDNTAGALISGYTGVYANVAATVINAGTIIGTGTEIGGVEGTAIYFSSTADPYVVLAPTGRFGGAVIAAAGNGVLELTAGTGPGTIANVGAYGLGAFVQGFANVTIDTGASWAFAGNTDIQTGQTLTDFGALTIGGAQIDGLVQLDGSVLDMNGPVTGAGTFVIGADSNAIFLGSVASTETIVFQGTGGTLMIGDLAEFGAAVIGEGDVEVICYLQGTRIMTAGGEMPVEALKAGDRLPSHFGGVQEIKWIGRQSFASHFIRNNPDCRPVRIEAGALGDNLPARDLYVSGGHSMLINGQLVLARHLINGVNITNHYAPDIVHYYQIEFATHDCVLAEGAWSESYADIEGMRNMFHNAASFYEQFPNHVSPPAPRLCAPRYLDGPKLDAALRPIMAQAEAEVTPGPLRGWLDTIEDEQIITGWAQDEANPELPVLLEIRFDAKPIGTVLACDYRADLVMDDARNGRQSFKFHAPLKITADVMDRVVVRRVNDLCTLPKSPAYLEKMQVAPYRVA